MCLLLVLYSVASNTRGKNAFHMLNTQEYKLIVGDTIEDSIMANNKNNNNHFYYYNTINMCKTTMYL